MLLPLLSLFSALLFHSLWRKQVEFGQEQVLDADGRPYDVVWSLDDQGNLRAQVGMACLPAPSHASPSCTAS